MSNNDLAVSLLGYLRKLARSLVGDVDIVDDLVQEGACAILEAPEGYSPKLCRRRAKDRMLNWIRKEKPDWRLP